MNKNKIKRLRVADDYLELVRKFPLRPIRREAEYDEAIEILKDLVGRADSGLSSGERDYTDALSQLVGIYEDANYPIEHELKTPLARLKYLIAQNDMNTTQLGELLGSGRGQASLILNGKRELSKANIRTLADRFKVSPALFL
ncbi:MAG TPA: helix-turn-helix domain-containing protein [Tepidisphaeraceae bacterium]|jgi:HTH-type transcriptional regulator/antitoxin HigA|nr:helix-turn-helix domain-containing protein [Tepidisphaeraceae bacterium]